MKKQSYQSKEVAFLQEVFADEINKLSGLNPFAKAVFSQLTNLFRILDEDEDKRSAIRRMLTRIKEEWNDKGDS